MLGSESQPCLLPTIIPTIPTNIYHISSKTQSSACLSFSFWEMWRRPWFSMNHMATMRFE